MTSIHTFDDDLARLDAVATAAAIRAGDLSAEEAVTAAIERSRRVEAAAHPIETEDFERAVEVARKGPRGPFAGVPTFIKDGTDVAGLPTRNGSASYASAPPAKATHEIAQQLFDLGAVNLGKSTLPEFGFTASTEFPDGPPTRNPWHLDHTAGGSSGGAGVLVASGAVPLAHGQDGGGSVRIPASCNGLVGLKPSRGRLVPDPHSRLLPLKIVADGVLTRTVRDTAAYYQAVEGRFRSKVLPPLGAVDAPIDRRLRIGTFVDTPTGAPVDGPTIEAHRATVSLLEGLGHDVVGVEVPFGQQFADDFTLYWAMLAFFTRYGGKAVFGRSYDKRGLASITTGLADHYKANARATVGAIRRLRQAAAVEGALYADLDVILSPVLAHLPPKLGVLGTDQPFDQLFPKVGEWVTFTPLANITGAPALSLPLGFDEPSGLPIGMMFSAAMGHDGLLLRLALELEAAQPFRTLAPSA